MAQQTEMDRAISSRDDDLLDMVPFAEQLALYLKTMPAPFTVGIYGRWGDGKTSFVNLVKASLTEGLAADSRPLFVDFSAWAYRGSDAVWRGLLHELANQIYARSGEQDEQTPARPEAPKSFVQVLADMLNREALVLRQPEPSAATRAYGELLDRLDRGAFGSIARGAPALNADALAWALIQALMAAAASVSPVAAAVRSLFKLEGLSPAELTKAEPVARGEPGTSAVGEFSQRFTALLEAITPPIDRIYVFIDDLDRCAPETALDVLEALRVFFDHIKRCVFLVAADERIVGKGLRLRYREMLLSLPDDALHAFYTQAGREYFEKIIQLYVRVPSLDLGRIRQYVAALFPEGDCAADLLQAALGNNPRRLKQYGYQMSFKYPLFERFLYGAAATPADSPARWLDKLAGLRALAPDLLPLLRRVSSAAELAALDQFATTPSAAPPAESELLAILARARQRPSLAKRLSSPPRFATLTPAQLRRLIDCVSYELEGPEGVRSADPLLSSVIKQLGDRDDGEAEALLVERLGRLSVALTNQTRPLLRDMLRGTTWRQDVTVVEQTVERLLAEHGSPEAFAEAMRTEIAQQQQPVLRELLELNIGGPPRANNAIATVELNAVASRASCVGFLAAPRLSSLLPEERDLVLRVGPAALSEAAGPGAQWLDLQAGQTILARLNPAERQALLEQMRSCVTIAARLRDRRAFAKQDLIETYWPDLQRLGAQAPALLERLEAAAREGVAPAAAGLPETWRGMLADENLVRLLRLGPALSELSDRQRRAFRRAARITPPTRSDDGQPRTAGLLPASRELVLTVSRGDDGRYRTVLRIEPEGAQHSAALALTEQTSDREAWPAGYELFQLFCPGDVGQQIRGAVEQADQAGQMTQWQICFESSEGWLADVPWEQIGIVPGGQVFAAQPGHLIGRVVQRVEPRQSSPIVPPLRVTLARLGHEDPAEYARLVERLKESIPVEVARFDLFIEEDPRSWQRKLADSLYAFGPHVLVLGSTLEREGSGTGLDTGGLSTGTLLSQLRQLLEARQLQVLVVQLQGSTDASGPQRARFGKGLADLAGRAAPIVVGNTRIVSRKAQSEFTRRFLERLLREGSVPHALAAFHALGDQRLSGEQHAFAIFATSPRLPQFFVPPGS